MTDFPKFPDLVVTHPAPAGSGGAIAARSARILLGGQDITHWVSDFRVGGALKGAVELHLTVLVSGVQWKQGADPDVPA